MPAELAPTHIAHWHPQLDGGTMRINDHRGVVADVVAPRATEYLTEALRRAGYVLAGPGGWVKRLDGSWLATCAPVERPKDVPPPVHRDDFLDAQRVAQHRSATYHVRHAVRKGVRWHSFTRRAVSTWWVYPATHDDGPPQRCTLR